MIVSDLIKYVKVIVGSTRLNNRCFHQIFKTLRLVVIGKEECYFEQQ